MRRVFAFVKRDFCIDVTYRFAFAFQVAWVLLSTACYFYLAKFMGPSMESGSLEAYGGSYFAFILMGVALNDYHTTSLNVFSRSIRESQLSGTLEALLTTQTSLPTIILSSAVYPFLCSCTRVLLHLAFGAWVFGMPLKIGNPAAALLILVLSVGVFSCFGILSAAFILMFKRTSPIALLMEGAAWLLGGVLYPVTVLPDWLRRCSNLLPITHAIEGLRAALLGDGSWERVWRSAVPLLILGAIFLPVSLLAFTYATRRAREWGTLSQY